MSISGYFHDMQSKIKSIQNNFKQNIYKHKDLSIFKKGWYYT